MSSAIVDKYIGESARLVREMFGYAKEHEPCIIFMDEVDAIGGRRFSEGTSADREIQRTLMEVRFRDQLRRIALSLLLARHGLCRAIRSQADTAPATQSDGRLRHVGQDEGASPGSLSCLILAGHHGDQPVRRRVHLIALILQARYA